MIMALFNGTIGLSLCLFLGLQILHLSPFEIGVSVVIANSAALFSLFATLEAEKNLSLKKTLLKGVLKTWIFLSLLFFSILLGLCPWLRDLHTFSIFFLPLILSTGFSLALFGPLQDLWVKHRHKNR